MYLEGGPGLELCPSVYNHSLQRVYHHLPAINLLPSLRIPNHLCALVLGGRLMGAQVGVPGHLVQDQVTSALT